MTPDYIDVAEEERAIQAGLSALYHYKTHPVLNTDSQRAALIEAAITALQRQRDRYRDDVLELRQEWGRIFEAGVSLQEARAKAQEKRPWWKLFTFKQ